MSINRTIAPSIQEISKIKLIHPEPKQLDNGIPFFSLISGTQPVLRLEFIFDAGSKHQDKTLVASFANSMLIEGTKKRGAQEIAEAFDYYGAFIQPEIDNDRASLTLHCLSKNFEKVFPIIVEIFSEISYPKTELDTNLRNGRQQFQVNSDKVEFVARKRFAQAVFGKNHPYGKQAEAEDFLNVKQEDLFSFFNSFYHPGNLTIVASGNFGSDVFTTVNETFGKMKSEKQVKKIPGIYTVPAPELVLEPKEKALQSGIRIGRQLMNKKNPDYVSFQVLNTALGGYFGSRLMANIREDKGYTYGIGSALVSLEDSGYFFIATEVGSDVCALAINEIYKEIDRLQQELIPDQELGMVKNYMLGSFLRHSEGPFAMADRFKGIHFYGLNYDYYDRYIETVNTISSQKLRELAQKHLNRADLTEVVAGKK